MKPKQLLPNGIGLASLFLAMALAASCRSSSSGGTPEAYPPVVPGNFGEMHNVSEAGPIWIGGMPTKDDLELAQRRGIQLVIDISVPSEPRTSDIPSECRLLGLNYATAGLADGDRLTAESVDLVLAELEEVAPTLMFCGTGSRSAMYLAIYRVTDLGVPLEEALVEARRAGMQAGEAAEFVRSEVARLQALKSSSQQ